MLDTLTFATSFKHVDALVGVLNKMLSTSFYDSTIREIYSMFDFLKKQEQKQTNFFNNSLLDKYRRDIVLADI